jgi:hypothetical protein
VAGFLSDATTGHAVAGAQLSWTGESDAMLLSDAHGWYESSSPMIDGSYELIVSKHHIYIKKPAQ